jgi:hypothetical protein
MVCMIWCSRATILAGRVEANVGGVVGAGGWNDGEVGERPPDDPGDPGDPGDPAESPKFARGNVGIPGAMGRARPSRSRTEPKPK